MDRQLGECFRPPLLRQLRKRFLLQGTVRAGGTFARMPQCVQRGARGPARARRRAWTGTLPLRKETTRSGGLLCCWRNQDGKAAPLLASCYLVNGSQMRAGSGEGFGWKKGLPGQGLSRRDSLSPLVGVLLTIREFSIDHKMGKLKSILGLFRFADSCRDRSKVGRSL